MTNLTVTERCLAAICLLVLVSVVVLSFCLVWALVSESRAPPSPGEIFRRSCRYKVRSLEDNAWRVVCLESSDKYTLVVFFKGCFCGSNYDWAVLELLPAADQIFEQGGRFVFLTPDDQEGFLEFRSRTLATSKYLRVKHPPLIYQDPQAAVAEFLGLVDQDSNLPEASLILLTSDGQVLYGLRGLPGEEPSLGLFFENSGWGGRG